MPEPISNKKKDKKEEFIEEFTKEILKTKKKKHDEKLKEQKEENRVKKAIEVAKLKQKFDSYGEKPEAKTEPKKEAQPQVMIQPVQIQQAPIAQQPQPPMIVQVKQPIKKPEQRIKAQNLPITQIAMPQQPLASNPLGIEFGKISFLVFDPIITYIECPGQGKNVIIKKAGVTTRTQLTLKDDEIRNIIRSFSERARIPLIEGMLNARVFNLEISAVISESASPSFIPKKIVVDLSPKQATNLSRPMMQFPQPGQQPPKLGPAMPPIIRPFSPGQVPQQPANQPFPNIPPRYPALPGQTQPQKPEEKPGFFNKKIKIGK